jgi:hypothetical protein
MQALAEQIRSTFETQRHCFVRPEELKRIWPTLHDEDREQIVREFARENGWRIFTYSRVLGAMFVAPSNQRGLNRT